MRSDRSIGRRQLSYSTLLLGALIFGIVSGCSLKSPSAPSWEVVFNLPLLNQWFDITDLMDDEDFVFVGSDSIYAIDFEQTLEKIKIGDDITLDDLNESISQAIGAFTVPSAPPQSVTFRLDALYPPIAGLTGSFPIPAFSIPAGFQKDLPPFDGFSQVVIDTGTVTLSVTNSTGVDFTSLGIRLLDEGADNAEVVNIDVTATGTIEDGETRVVQKSLAGVTTGNDLILEATGQTPGGVKDLDGNEGIDVVVTVGELRVSSATAEVSEIDFDFYPTIPITDSTRVQSALLSAGNLTLTLNNQLPISLDLTIELPNITDGAGSPVLLGLVASPGAPDSDSRDLAGHTLAPSDDGSGGKELALTVNVHSSGSSGSQVVTLSSTDSVSVQAAVTGLVVQEVTGVLDQTTISIPEESFELVEESGNLFDEARKFELTDVDLELTIRHNIDFPVNLQLNLIGEGGTPDPVQLNLIFDLVPSGFTPTGPGDTSAVTRVYTLTDLNETEANLLQFLNAFPTTIRSSGSASVGDGTYLGSVSSYSSFQADLYFSTPLQFNITESISIELDKEYSDEGLEMDEGGVEIQEVTLTYSISSTMGLPLTVRMMVAADSSLVYTDPDVELVLAIRSTGEAAQDTVITLTREKWDLLRQPFYTGVRIDIPPTGGTPFRLAKNDRLFTKAFATLRAIIDPDDSGGGGGR